MSPSTGRRPRRLDTRIEANSVPRLLEVRDPAPHFRVCCPSFGGVAPGGTGRRLRAGEHVRRCDEAGLTEPMTPFVQRSSVRQRVLVGTVEVVHRREQGRLAARRWSASLAPGSRAALAVAVLGGHLVVVRRPVRRPSCRRKSSWCQRSRRRLGSRARDAVDLLVRDRRAAVEGRRRPGELTLPRPRARRALSALPEDRLRRRTVDRHAESLENRIDRRTRRSSRRHPRREARPAG